VFTPGGVRVVRRVTYGIAMTGAIPMPRETTQTKVKARALARARAAWRRSRQRPAGIVYDTCSANGMLLAAERLLDGTWQRAYAAPGHQSSRTPERYVRVS
jgi:hypothetical protein